MDPSVYKQPRTHEDALEDTAIDFLEGEVGRFDYKNNWPKFKANHEGILERRVQAWLDYMGISGEFEPKDIIEFLDQLVQNRTGAWR